MRWSSLTITNPRGELSRGEVRDYIALKSDNTGHNALIDRIRFAVVADAEYYLRRAIFTQRRSFTGWVDSYVERARRSFQFEPLTNATFRINGAARPFTMRGDDTIRLNEVWHPNHDDTLEVTYDAGFSVGLLPADLHEALLAECQRRYERMSAPAAGASDEKAMLKLAPSSGLTRYRAANEPLVYYLVEIGAEGA